MATKEETEAALGYAWSVLREIAKGAVPIGEAPAQYAARNMEDLRKYHPQAVEGL